LRSQSVCFLLSLSFLFFGLPLGFFLEPLHFFHSESGFFLLLYELSHGADLPLGYFFDIVTPALLGNAVQKGVVILSEYFVCAL
jgi:hypothetical protein